jgi:hypothetical protein
MNDPHNNAHTYSHYVNNMFTQNLSGLNFSTGSQLFDTLIIVNTIPFLISYFSSLLTAMFTFFVDLFKIWIPIFNLRIISYFKKRVIGETKYYYKLNNDNYIYHFLIDNVLKKSNGDDIMWYKLKYLKNRVVSEGLEFKRSVAVKENVKIKNYVEEYLTYTNNTFIISENENKAVLSTAFINTNNIYTGITSQPKPFTKAITLRYNSNLIFKINKSPDDLYIKIVVKNNTDSGLELLNKLYCMLNNRFNMQNEAIFYNKLHLSNSQYKGIICSLNKRFHTNDLRFLKYLSEVNYEPCGKLYENTMNNKIMELNIKNDTDFIEDLNKSELNFIDHHNNVLSSKELNDMIQKYFYRASKIQRLGYFYYKNALVVINFADELMDRVLVNSALTETSLSLTIYIFSHGAAINGDYVDDVFKYLISKCAEPTNVLLNQSKKKMQFNIRRNGQWSDTTMDTKTYSSIFLPHKIKNEIVSEVTNFISKKNLYTEFEIPHRKGILLYGPPGTGKTSIVRAISYEHQLPIYSIDLNDDEINDSTIQGIINSMPKYNKILLFEDIDSAFADKEKLKKEVREITELNDKNETIKKDIKFLTYSGLLNALDGVSSNHYGTITIMTTNNIEKLGSALIRPGRMDLLYELKECDRDQMLEMVEYFYVRLTKHSGGKLLKNYKNIIQMFVRLYVDSYGNTKVKPCDLQSYLLKFIDAPDEMFNNSIK